MMKFNIIMKFTLFYDHYVDDKWIEKEYHRLRSSQSPNNYDNYFPIAARVYFNLPIDDYSLSPKMKRWVTMYELINHRTTNDINWLILMDEITTFDDFIDLSYYIIQEENNQHQQVNFNEALELYLKKDINRQRIIRRNMIIKDELFQVTHQIGGEYYKENLQEGLKLWNSHS